MGDFMSKYIIKVNGNPYEVEVQEIGGPSAPMAAAPIKPKAKSAKAAASTVASAGDVIAPMPGTVLKLKVASGEAVKKGQVVLILEAMKMENEIVAPVDGTVTLNVEAGQSVTARQVMATIA